MSNTRRLFFRKLRADLVAGVLRFVPDVSGMFGGVAVQPIAIKVERKKGNHPFVR